MEAFVFIILQTFFAASPVLKIGEYHWDIPQFQLGPVYINLARAEIFHGL